MDDSLSFKKNFDERVSLEDFEKFPSKSSRINDPLSLSNIKQSGITQKELYPNSQNEYLIKNNDSKGLIFDLKESKFNFFDNQRTKNNNILKKLKNKLFKNENQNSRNKSFSLNKKKDINYQNDNFSLLNEEIKFYEKYKSISEKELLNLIEKEINKTIIQKNYEKKMQKQKEKFYNSEEKDKTEKKKQKLKEEENKKNYYEEINKRKILNEKINKELEENRKKMEKKLFDFNEKEKKRLLNLEYQKELNLINQKEQDEIRKKKINEAQKNFELKLNEKRNIFLSKEKNNEEIKKKLEENKIILQKQKNEDDYQKKLKIKKKLEEKDLLTQKKYEEYNNKQKIFYEKQKLKEQKQKLEIQEREKENILKTNLLKKNLERNLEIINEKREKLLKKFESKESFIKKLNKEKKREFLLKSEEEKRRKFIKDDNLRKINNIQNYEKEKILELIEEKFKKIDNIKYNQEKLREKKDKISNKIKIEKNINAKKINRIFSKQNIDIKDLENFRNLFPNSSSKFNNLIQQFKNCENENNKYNNFNLDNKSLDKSSFITSINYIGNVKKSNSSNNIFNDNKNSFSNINDIERKINNYSVLYKNNNVNKIIKKVNENQIKINNMKLELNKQLMNMIENEEKNETERKNKFNNISDDEIKNNLSKQFSEERALATKKINELSLSNEKKIEEYIKSLEQN